MAGQLCRCRKPRNEAGGILVGAGELLGLRIVGVEEGKNDVIGFWRKGAIPFTFQEKMRNVLGVGIGIAGGDSGGCGNGGCAVIIWLVVFRRLDGGGLIARLIV